MCNLWSNPPLLLHLCWRDRLGKLAPGLSELLGLAVVADGIVGMQVAVAVGAAEAVGMAAVVGFGEAAADRMVEVGIGVAEAD